MTLAVPFSRIRASLKVGITWGSGGSAQLALRRRSRSLFSLWAASLDLKLPSGQGCDGHDDDSGGGEHDATDDRLGDRPRWRHRTGVPELPRGRHRVGRERATGPDGGRRSGSRQPRTRRNLASAVTTAQAGVTRRSRACDARGVLVVDHGTESRRRRRRLPRRKGEAHVRAE